MCQEEGKDWRDRELQTVSLYLRGSAQKAFYHSKMFSPERKGEREETEMENVKCISLAQKVHVSVTCRPVGLGSFFSRREGDWMSIFGRVGCSSRQSLVNNTVPGLSWLSWWALFLSSQLTIIFNKPRHHRPRYRNCMRKDYGRYYKSN